MPYLHAPDGTRLCYEETGIGSAVVFIDEYVGDEDEPCLEGSFFLKRTVPTAALLVIPRAGHNITSEEPAQFNAALAELFSAAESACWRAHKPV